MPQQDDFRLSWRETQPQKWGNIQVNIDSATLNKDFLIRCASINIVGGKDVMLSFPARNYLKQKNQMDQKRIELAFFKGLRHILSRKYPYTILGDREFANSRLLQILEDLKFDYVLRIKENPIVQKEHAKRENWQKCAGQNEFFSEK
jgi:hypothetical protein